MERKYKRPERINVYKDQESKDVGAPQTMISRVPLNYTGFDSYEYLGRIYRGWLDRQDPQVDACIILDLP